MKDYLPFIVTGITSGSVYGLAAVGLVLSYKTSGIFNFGHGAQAALAAYLMFEFRERMGLPWPIAALLSLLLAGILAGIVLERGARVLAEVSVAARVAAAVGLLVAVQGSLVAVFGAASISMRPFLSQQLVQLPGVTVRVEQLLIVVFVLLAVVALSLFFSRTTLGLAVQGVVDDPALIGLVGISAVAVRRFSWIVGSCFAAISGMLLAPLITLDAGILTLLVFYAFGAAAIGTFSSLPITYVGGLAIGLAISMLTKLLGEANVTGPLSQLPANLPFLVLFSALLVVPRRRLVERGTQVLRRPLAPVVFSRRTTSVGLGLGAAVVLLLPHVAGTRLPLYTTALAEVTLFASLSLLVRMSRQVSLCQIAFSAVGACVSARAVGAGIPWGAALVLGGLVAIPVGALVAIPAIRLSGVYLAIATFGFGLVVQRMFYPTFLMFGASLEIHAPRPDFAPLQTSGDVGYYYVVLAVTLASAGALALLRRSRGGRLLRAFADSATAVDAHGTDTNELKVLVFCISAFFAAIAGALMAPVTGTAAGGSVRAVGGFDASVSLLVISVLFIAGRQPLLSAIAASVIFVVIPGYMSAATSQKYAPVAFGILAVGAAMSSGRSIIERLRASERIRERIVEGSPQQHRRFAHQLSASVEAR